MSGSAGLSGEQRAAPVLAEIRSRLADVFADDGGRAAQAFSVDTLRRGTAVAARQFMSDPSHYGRLEENSGPAARRMAADLIAMRAAFERGMQPPDGMTVATLGDEQDVRASLRRQMNRLLVRLYPEPHLALRALDEASGGRGPRDPSRPLLDFSAVLAGDDPRLRTSPQANPAEVGELASVARALEAVGDFEKAQMLRPPVAERATEERSRLAGEARRASGQKLSEALGIVYGDGPAAAAAEKELLRDVARNGLFVALDRFVRDPGTFGKVEAAAGDRDKFAAVVRERTLEFVHALETESYHSGTSLGFGRPYSDADYALASREADRLEAKMEARAKQIFKDPAAARAAVGGFMRDSVADQPSAIAVRTSVWTAVQAKDAAFKAPGLLSRVADAAEYARDAGALAHVAAMKRHMELVFAGRGGMPRETGEKIGPLPVPRGEVPPPPAPPIPASYGTAEIVGVPAPPAREEMDAFRQELDGGRYSTDWLPDSIRGKVVGIQVGLRNVSIALNNESTLVDAGPMGLSLKGKVDAETVSDLLRAVAAKGMTAVKLSGSDAFKDRACVEFAMMRPPIMVTNHEPSPEVALVLREAIEKRGPLTGPASGPDGPSTGR